MGIIKSILGFLDKKPVAVKQTSEAQFKKALLLKIPSEAVDYTLQLWIDNPFNFRISRARKSVLGLYTFKNKQHFISVNGDSNSYSFLITLIHEIAHQHVNLKHSKATAPHGQEWKNTFKQLLSPLLRPDVFPEDVLLVLKNHMKNPAASSAKDPALVKILAKYSPQSDVELIALAEVEIGETFTFQKRTFKKLEVRRTRSLVELTKNKKHYTIPEHALVAKIEKKNN